jgi:hypothetical protein
MTPTDAAIAQANELMPCPFCGGAAELHEGQKHGRGWAQASCADSLCGTFKSGIGRTKELRQAEAIAAWNRRATPPESGGQGENGVLHVECRQCDECGHAGIDDTTDATACSYCDWRGSDPGEDKCPECNRVGTMTSGCPNCGGRYIFLADADFSHPPAQASAAVTERVARAIAAVNNGHPDHTPQPTIDAFWGLLDADQQDRYRRMAHAAIGAMGGGE